VKDVSDILFEYFLSRKREEAKKIRRRRRLVDGHNQMKEVKIIKNLTEKLKNEGDVSQEEADLV